MRVKYGSCLRLRRGSRRRLLLRLLGWLSDSSAWSNQMLFFDGTTRSCAGCASLIRQDLRIIGDRVMHLHRISRRREERRQVTLR
ncbi:hypothetical protein DD238_004882 [Peronospora effusa]|uniref:Uncharacterized protein n=1 Tax=Peronospora effusa TaxID=542832 RepID=A0A3M6VLV4_9STRA|nr:hypothetical protein DD238_004882 [Peronospora effusa]